MSFSQWIRVVKMHDPHTVAFDIKYPWKGKCNYYSSFITIWHKDPETDGTDDSCGWFMRARHCSEKNLERVIKDYEFEWDADYGGWFNKNGTPRLSVIAITLAMFSRAAYAELRNWNKVNRFMNKNLYEFIQFAENNVDTAHCSITSRYGFSEREARIRSMAVMFHTYVCRKLRPWYKHPRWHIHHWRIQVHPWQKLRRYLFVRCSRCGKRFGWNACPTGNWSGTELWHSDCYGEMRDEKSSNGG